MIGTAHCARYPTGLAATRSATCADTHRFMGESLDAPAAAPTYAAGLNGRAKSLAVAGKSPQMQQHPAVLAQSSRDFVVTADLATVTHPAIRHRAH